MKPLPKSPLNRSSAGFSLVEIVIAIGVAAFCLVAMLGLIPTGLKSVKTSIAQTTATEALDAVAVDLRSAQPGTNVSPIYGIPIPTGNGVAVSTNFYVTEEGSQIAPATEISAQYGVIATLSNASTFLTTADIRIYWPPTLATNQLQNAQGIVETVISFNRN